MACSYGAFGAGITKSQVEVEKQKAYSSATVSATSMPRRYGVNTRTWKANARIRLRAPGAYLHMVARPDPRQLIS